MSKEKQAERVVSGGGVLKLEFQEGWGGRLKKPTTKIFLWGRGMDMFWNNQTHDELCTRGVFVFSIYQSNIA